MLQHIISRWKSSKKQKNRFVSFLNKIIPSEKLFRLCKKIPFRKLSKWGLYLSGAFFSLVIFLSVLWLFIAPVSTLMLKNWLTFQPVQRQFVAIDSISPQLILSVLHSEDARFCSHNGVDWNSLFHVLKRSGSINRGASTITMQTVKNLYLWHNRSYLRKILEFPLTLYTNTFWSKRHTLETYLNIAEWGPNIFGVEAASQYYFKKSSMNLSLQEAALLASALPNPTMRNPAQPSLIHQNLSKAIVHRVKNNDTIAECIFKNKEPAVK